MPFDYNRLITYERLRLAAELSPENVRLREYAELKALIEDIDGSMFITLTTTTAVSDEIAFEDLCRRFVHQLTRTVIGKRTDSTIPILTVLERGVHASYGCSALHAHIVVGKVIGKTREQNQTNFRHYLSKKPYPAALHTLRKLTYRTTSNRIGRVGICRIEPIDSRKQLSDYLLKGLKNESLNIAWLATTVAFKKPSLKIEH